MTLERRDVGYEGVHDARPGLITCIVSLVEDAANRVAVGRLTRYNVASQILVPKQVMEVPSLFLRSSAVRAVKTCLRREASTRSTLCSKQKT